MAFSAPVNRDVSWTENDFSRTQVLNLRRVDGRRKESRKHFDSISEEMEKWKMPQMLLQMFVRFSLNKNLRKFIKNPTNFCFF